MASMIDIKRRKASIQNTGQITKAMKLVATVKLQKSKNKAVNGKPYLNMMYSEVHSILNDSSFFPHPFLNSNNSRKK